MLVAISLSLSLLLSVSGAPFDFLGYFYPLRGPSVLLYPSVSLPLYSPPYFNIREQREPGRARHSGHGDHDHHDDHDTDASIQTILKDLVKQSNQLGFSCEAEGSFPHPLDCSKYYLCDEDKEEGEEFDCLYNLTGLFFNKETGQCDWAAKTVCFSQDNGDSDIEAVEAEVDYDCEVPGVFADPDYCMRYIRCSNQLFASLEYCTTGTFFDEFAEKCLWASQVDCGTRGQVDLGFEDDIIRRFQLF